jgi:hypothetical protein
VAKREPFAASLAGVGRRHWEFDLADGHHVVDLVHRYFLGTRTRVVDGTKTLQRTFPFTNHAGEHAFPLPGHDARLRITTNGVTYDYDLVVDGRAITVDGAAAKPARPRLGGPGSQRVAGIVMLPLFSCFRRPSCGAGTRSPVPQRECDCGRHRPGQADPERSVRADLRAELGLHHSMGDVHAYTGDVPRATYERRAPGAAT